MLPKLADELIFTPKFCHKKTASILHCQIIGGGGGVECNQVINSCLKETEECSIVNNVLLTGKTKRLKEAKEEAQAEIEVFRKEQEKEFQDYQKDVCRFVKKTTKIYF